MRSGPSFIGLSAVAFVVVTCAAAESRHPAEVEAAIEAQRKYCLEEGGTALEFEQEPVRKVDLTGDGRPDYIVSFRDAKCRGRDAMFCGTGGCNLIILVTKRDGTLVTVFDDYAWHYEIGSKPGRKTIRFEMHRSFCEPPAKGACVKTHRITEKPFGFNNR